MEPLDPSSPPAVIQPADAALALLVEIDSKVDGAEHDGIYARWEFGRQLLKERQAAGGKQLPHGRLNEVCAATKKSRQELQFRMQFAEKHDTREKVSNALDTFRSWHQIVNRTLAEKRATKEDDRERRREENRRKVEATDDLEALVETGARFACIVLDPPWDWGDESDVDQMGRARPTYITMTLEELLELPVGELADTDAHIYLWITNRSLPKGFELLKQWGFRYITAITWVKPHYGMGNYFRGQTEHMLFGVKGSQPLKRKDAGTVLAAPRGPAGHSSKPTESYELIESCSPGPYLELFARGGRPDWTSWGADADEAD